MKPFINVHTHKTSDGQLSLINAPYEGLWPKSEYYSYGLHPWDIGILNAVHEFEMIKKYCSERKILAVGEIGIDRAIHASIETQSNLFIEQLGIAEWYGLPVIIHCVRAYSDILEIKKKRKHTTPWILHGFAGNFQTAEQLILAGCFLSFGSKLLINQSVQKSFELAPLSNVFFETDDSDTKIEEIYTKASELIDVSISELKTIIYNNFTKVFAI